MINIKCLQNSITEKEGACMVNQGQDGKEKTMELIHGYVGTYYSQESQGVYRFSFDPDSGRLTEPELFYEAHGAKWISLNSCSMVIPIEEEGRAGSCFLELRDGRVKEVARILKEQETPCYILQDGDYVYTANYHDGNVMAYRLEEGRPFLMKRIDNGEGAGCHQILLHETYLMVPCLTQNRIRLFDRAKDFSPAGEIAFPHGCGPRHGVFNQEHTRFYLISEWSNELFVFKVYGREFVLQQVESILLDDSPGRDRAAGEDGERASGAAIRLTRDGNFLYVSVRGLNEIVAFDLREGGARQIQRIFSEGSHPRDFILSGDERFLLVANRFEGGIVSMERDLQSGLLKNVVHRVLMPQGVALSLE